MAVPRCEPQARSRSRSARRPSAVPESDDMVRWVHSNDEKRVICVCVCSHSHSTHFKALFENIKAATYGLLNFGPIEDCYIGLDTEEDLWPQEVKQLLKNGKDGVLAIVNSGSAKGVAAIGAGPNMKLRSRACALALVITAWMGTQCLQGITSEELDEYAPGLSSIVGKAEQTFPYEKQVRGARSKAAAAPRRGSRQQSPPAPGQQPQGAPPAPGQQPNVIEEDDQVLQQTDDCTDSRLASRARYCYQCGSKLGSGFRFCTQCGHPVRS